MLLGWTCAIGKAKLIDIRRRLPNADDAILLGENIQIKGKNRTCLLVGKKDTGPEKTSRKGYFLYNQQI